MLRLGRIGANVLVAVVITAVLAVLPAIARTTQHLARGSSVRQSVSFSRNCNQPPARATVHRPDSPAAALTSAPDATSRQHPPAVAAPLPLQLLDASPGPFRAPPVSRLS